MPNQNTPTPTEPQARTVHALTARPLVHGPKPQRTRAPRRKTLLTEAEIDAMAEKVAAAVVRALPADNDDENEWDEWEAKRHAH